MQCFTRRAARLKFLNLLYVVQLIYTRHTGGKRWKNMQFSDCEKLLFCERTFSVPEGPAMPPGKRKAAASSAADGAAPAAGQREERERGFDAKAVKDFLAKIQRPEC